MSEKVAAVVVTYNREQLLSECLEAIKNQSRKLDAIYIVDNKSDKPTPELLIKKGWIDNFPEISPEENEIQEKRIENEQNGISLNVVYIRKKENDGGAGGFYEGIKQAYEGGYDLIWIMDDDVIPRPEALQELILASCRLKKFGFLCSRVVGNNGISMNIPEIDYKKGKNFYPVWDELLDHGLVRVKSATFVSVLFPSEIIKQVGYPVREMFIWGDDAEYTLRISGNYPCYLAGKSVVCHKREISKPPSVKVEKDKKRVEMQQYYFRNSIYNNRRHTSKSRLFVFLMESLYKIFFLLMHLRFYAAYIVIKGIMKGMFFDPEIHYPDS
jgi:GT2 family glycosyltransferase